MSYRWNPDNPDPLQEHSAAKHDIIRAYLERYIRTLAANFRQRRLKLSIIDGFAGGNLFQVNGIIVPGSPGIFVETVYALRDEIARERTAGFDLDVDFYFFEKNRRAFKLLHDTFANGPFKDDLDKRIHLVRGDFLDHIDTVVARIRGQSRSHRALFLLDQYGWSQVPFERIRFIRDQLDNAEIFLTFAVDHLVSYLTEGKDAEAAKLRIGLTMEVVRELIEKFEHGSRALVQHALFDHVWQECGFRHASPFVLNSTTSNRALWFIHLSRAWKAREVIGDVHWEAATDRVSHYGDAGFQAMGYRRLPGFVDDGQIPLLNFGDVERQVVARAAAAQLPDLIASRAAETSEPVTVRHILDTRGTPTPVTLSILSDAARELHIEGDIMVLNEEGKPRRKGVALRSTDQLILPPQRRFYFPR